VGPVGRCLPAAYAFFAVMAGTALPTPLYPLYEQRLGLSPLLVTVVFAVYAVAVIASLLLFGRLSDQLGRRPLLLPGVVVSALSAVILLAARGLPLLLLGRVVCGLAAGVWTGTGTAAVVDLAGAGGRARATRLAVAANLGGLGAGQLLSGVLAQAAPHPLRLPYAAELVLLVPAALAVLLGPETVRRGRVRWRVQGVTVPPQVRGAFVPAVVAGFCGFAVFAVYGALVPGFIAKSLRLPDPALVGVLMFVLLLAATAGQLLVEWLGEQRSLAGGLGGLTAGALLLGAAVASTTLPPLVVSIPLLGLGQGLVIGSGLGSINRLAPPKRRSEVASSYFLVLYVGLTLPVLGVGVATVTLGIRLAGLLFSGAVAAVVGGVGLALLARGRGRRPRGRPALG
jgi:MFS family permease